MLLILCIYKTINIGNILFSREDVINYALERFLRSIFYTKYTEKGLEIMAISLPLILRAILSGGMVRRVPQGKYPDRLDSPTLP